MSTPRRRALGVALALAVGVAVVVAVVLFVRQDSPSRGSDPGPEGAEAYVREYVAALNANEPGTVAELVGRPVDSDHVTDLLDQRGGRGLTDVVIRIEQDFPYVYFVSIDAKASTGEPVHIYDQVEWDRDRWWLALPGEPGR